MTDQRKPDEAPPTTWRCLVAGCPIEGVWQPIIPGEEFMADTADKRGHYWREHYLANEAAYRERLRDQRNERMAHYRRTGQLLPPRG